MKHLLKYLGVLSGAVLLCLGATGCGGQADAPEGQTTDVLKQSIDRGHDVETTSNINQINQALGMYKSDAGSAPATIEDAKKAAKVPDVMWLDKATGKPLEYDPATGTVHRAGAAADTPPAAGAPGAPSDLKLPSAAGGGGY